MARDSGSNPPPARVALVTGASGGIGRHLAVGLARANVASGLHGRDGTRLAETRREVTEIGAPCHVVTADVTHFDEVQRTVAEVEDALGGIDLLINNAGAIESEEVPIWEADPQEWWHVVDVDLRGPFHLVRAVVPGMVARGGGRVIDINSGAGTRDMDEYSAYNVAKTALFRIGGGVHAAGYERGLRAFEVAPGVVPTAMSLSMSVHAGRTEWTEPQDIVDLITAIARGELDDWSGSYLRAGSDTVAILTEVAARGRRSHARTLGIRPWGPDDPVA